MSAFRMLQYRPLMWALALLMALASCLKEPDSPSQGISLSVRLGKPSEFSSSSVDLSGIIVSLTSSTGAYYEQETDAEGVATFPSIIPEIYALSAVSEISGADYTRLTGIQVGNNDYRLSATLSDQVLSGGQTLSLPLVAQAKSSLLISKVYYAGSKDTNNRNYTAGQYVEIFNNSDEEIDLTGLYLGIVESYSSSAFFAERVEQSAFLKQVYRIPAKRLAPGATVLLVNSAIDHRDKSEHEQDLSQADFEAKDTSPRNPRPNNADIPALELVYTFSDALSYMNLVGGGPTSLVIFRTDLDLGSLPRYRNTGTTTGNGLCLALPVETVIDGVDLLKLRAGTSESSDAKKLATFIDAGYKTINSTTGYTGEVVVRRVERRESGRVYLMDTNNSTNDLEVRTGVSVRGY